MKIQFRSGVFETNSSSVHTMTICAEGDFQKWIDGKVYFYDDAEEKFLTEEKAREMWEAEPLDEPPVYPEEDYEEYRHENGILTYEEWINHNYLDIYERHHTSPSGDELVIFGKYGMD